MSAKRNAFTRLATKRTQTVIDKIRILSNCANPYVYEYTEDDVKRIFNAIEQEIKAAKGRFVGRRKHGFTLDEHAPQDE